MHGPPASDDLRVGGEVGTLGRHGRQRRAQDRGQAHQGGVDVAFGDRGIPILDGVHPRTSRQQPELRIGAGGDHAGTPPLDGGGVPDEVHHVAQALLGVEQDRAPRDVLAPPGRAADGDSPVIAAEQPPLVLGPPPLVIAVRQPEEGAIPVGLGEVRSDRQRPLVPDQRLVPPALPRPRHAEVIERLGEIGPESQGRLEAGHGLVEFAEVGEGDAQIHPGLGRIGLEPERPPVEVDRLDGTTLLPQGVAEIVQNAEVVGGLGERPAIEPLGFLDPALLPDRSAQVVQGTGMPRPVTEDFPEIGFRLGEPTPPEEGHRLVEVS